MNKLKASSFEKGVNVIGYFGKCLGLAQSARLIITALQKQSIPFSLISAHSMADQHPQEDFDLPISNEFSYPINLFCIDPNQICPFIEKLDWNHIKNCTNIALLFWETNRLPKKAKNWWNYLDEVWTTSHYVHEHLSIAAPCPVYRIPQPIELLHTSLQSNKANFKLKNHFTFLFYFSFFSIVNRKNPLAIIHAFKKAFPERQDVQLVIKSQNGNYFPDQLELFLKEINQDARIVWTEQTMDSKGCLELMNVCDCYISLHRSEGFGLTMAEAMLLEKPVIATGYSGNLDFMNEENSFLCSHRLIPVGKGNFYPPDGVWADVDVDHAAHWMNYVLRNPKETSIKAKKGKEYVINHHSCASVGEKIAWRLNQISPLNNPKPIPWKYKASKIQQKCDRIKRKIKHQIKDLIGKG